MQASDHVCQAFSCAVSLRSHVGGIEVWSLLRLDPFHSLGLILEGLGEYPCAKSTIATIQLWAIPSSPVGL
jgi:hypothetical protein